MSQQPITFSRSLYSEEGVRQAVGDWKDVVELEVAVEGSEILVKIGDYDGDAEALRDEFKNHALYASIMCANDHEAN